MIVEFSKFDIPNVKSIFIKESGDTVMILKDGTRKSTSGMYVDFEGIVRENGERFKEYTEHGVIITCEEA